MISPKGDKDGSGVLEMNVIKNLLEEIMEQNAEVYLVDGPIEINGKLTDGVRVETKDGPKIYINENSKYPIPYILRHELAHAYEDPEKLDRETAKNIAKGIYTFPEATEGKNDKKIYPWQVLYKTLDEIASVIYGEEGNWLDRQIEKVKGWFIPENFRWEYVFSHAEPKPTLERYSHEPVD